MCKRLGLPRANPTYHYLFCLSQRPGGCQEYEQVSAPRRLGGGRGRVNPPPFGRLFEASTCLEARGLGGLPFLVCQFSTGRHRTGPDGTGPDGMGLDGTVTKKTKRIVKSI